MCNVRSWIDAPLFSTVYFPQPCSQTSASLGNVIVIRIGQRDVGHLLQLALILLLLLQINLHLRGRKRHLLHKVQVGVPVCGARVTTPL